MTSDVENYILETLSFFEPMNKEQLIFDFDLKKLETFRDFDLSQLDLILKNLVKRKIIKKMKIAKEVSYLKVSPSRRSLLQKLMCKFF